MLVFCFSGLFIYGYVMVNKDLEDFQ